MKKDWRDDPKTHEFSANCGSWEGAKLTCWLCGRQESEHGANREKAAKDE